MYTYLRGAIAICAVLAFSGAARAGEGTPFDSYVHVPGTQVFVFEKSQFSEYKGPDVSHWNLPYNEEPDDPAYNRVRLGIISLTPTQRIYVDVTTDPLSATYEFRDVKTGALIDSFHYSHGFVGALLFNGQGVLYQYDGLGGLCNQGRATRKFQLKKGKLVEVAQPLVYFENSATTTTKKLTLHLEPRESSSQVGTLEQDTRVDILTVGSDGWFLIKTPLGLTGWVQEGLNVHNCG